ncbi:RES family NAD+ phosphorylase [Bacillus mycoides]|uniref:RES family NAD+ phosphorylase n=1 Tax=Bacillus mycoides TaxID=1405 RepID=UPI0010BE291F|nr:RES family NAD+ phosphorylase [Bacillus mycoides]TKI45573.1 RES domain-containing protein [Bacillus mycoides]
MEGCQHCFYPDIFSLLDTLKIRDIPCTVQSYRLMDGIKICPNCQNELSLNEYFIEGVLDFEVEISEIIAQNINEDIAECQSCNEDKILYEQKHGDVDNLTTVFELVSGYGLPEKIEGLVYEKIKCRCGNELEYDQPFVTEEELENWYDSNINVVIGTFGIPSEDAEEFIQFLLKNPMMGIEHTVGKYILARIKEQKIPNLVDINPGEIYFRGRKRNPLEKIESYIEDELWSPPHGISNQGRFNPSGISALYLADNQEIILEELNVCENEVADIGEFVILESIRVWDICDLDIDLLSIPSLNTGSSLSYEYVFPNFIAQCLTLVGINGIKYSSTKGPGENVCLFSFEKQKDIGINNIKSNIEKPKPPSIPIRKNDEASSFVFEDSIYKDLPF